MSRDRITPGMKAMMQNMRLWGYSQQETAKACGVSLSTIIRCTKAPARVVIHSGGVPKPAPVIVETAPLVQTKAGYEPSSFIRPPDKKRLMAGR